MRDISSVKRRVRGLLSMAALGSGATGPERATARRLADGLMASNRVREQDVQARGPNPLGGVVFDFGVGSMRFNFAGGL